jgi:hypothetical protein
VSPGLCPMMAMTLWLEGSGAKSSRFNWKATAESCGGSKLSRQNAGSSLCPGVSATGCLHSRSSAGSPFSMRCASASTRRPSRTGPGGMVMSWPA